MTVGAAVLANQFLLNETDSANILDNGDSICNDTALSHKPRYKVEYKSFRTGKWYTKTETDNIGGAYSVATDYNSYGRAYRLTDTYTGEVLKEADEDSGIAETNGYPNGYPW